METVWTAWPLSLVAHPQVGHSDDEKKCVHISAQETHSTFKEICSMELKRIGAVNKGQQN